MSCNMIDEMDERDDVELEELDHDLVEYHEERECIFRKIDEVENKVLALRLDLDNHGGGVPMLKQIACAEARIAALHDDVEELDNAWVSSHAFYDVVM